MALLLEQGVASPDWARHLPQPQWYDAPEGLLTVCALIDFLTANPAAKIIILSAHSDDEYIDRMTQAGVAGFLEKQSSAEILTQAIQEVFFAAVRGEDELMDAQAFAPVLARNGGGALVDIKLA